MKNNLLSLLLLLISIPLLAQESEKQTIIHVIEAQHKAFAARDYDGWAAHQIQTEEFVFIGNSGVPNTGWKVVSKRLVGIPSSVLPSMGGEVAVTPTTARMVCRCRLWAAAGRAR